MNMQFWVQMVVYALSVGSLAGTILTRLKYLEKKVDSINAMCERVAKVEQQVKSAHYRLDAMSRPTVRKSRAK